MKTWLLTRPKLRSTVWGQTSTTSMSQPLATCFGPNASVSGSTLTIDLAPLAAASGFDGNISTASPAALLWMILDHVKTNTSEKTDDPSFGVTVQEGFQQLVLRGSENHRSSDVTVSFYSPDPQATVDPDDLV